MNSPQPTREDESSFGCGPSGGQRDPFGAHEITFRHDDLFPFGSDDATREARVKRFGTALEAAGRSAPW